MTIVDSKVSMRLLPVVLALVSASAVASCAHEGAKPEVAVPGPEARASTVSAPSGPTQYLIADPPARVTSRLITSLGPNQIGVAFEKRRVVIGRGEPRVARDLAEEPIVAVSRIRGRFGGGFLFQTSRAVYRAETFDGPLRPMARFPDAISDFAFAPRGLLVRTNNGERWSIAVPSGARAPIDPPGVADVEGLDDGRALAFDDAGSVFSSMDGGGHWSDVTARTRSAPSRVAVVGEELWLFESGGGALRLEADGRLSAFDKQPEDKPLDLRTPDPRWHGFDTPLRTVFQSGGSIDENTAVVIAGGDVVRVDVQTGEIVGVVAGKAPPDGHCEAVPTAGDVLFACISSSKTDMYVVSRTLGDAPRIEQSFSSGGRFFASDDGGLAVSGGCDGPSAAPLASMMARACVRQPDGTWQDRDVFGFAPDASGPLIPEPVRWVPRADGRAVALAADPPAIYDPQAGVATYLAPADRDALLQGLGVDMRYRGRHVIARVDWSWSFVANGSLRGWQDRGGSVAISPEGRVTRSPYSFAIASHGPLALGSSGDGRLYQSTDHGESWVEVAAPPGAAFDVKTCSAAGCDLGSFYRIGWNARPPRVESVAVPAPPASLVARTPPIELGCKVAGAPVTKLLARTSSSPDDLGLGASRLPVQGERSDVAFVRAAIGRGIQNPVHDTSPSEDGAVALRAVLSGYQATRDSGDVIEVVGPNKRASQLRRVVSFVAPFDPLGRSSRATIAMSDVISAGLAAGMSSDEILSDDMTEAGAFVPITPFEASGSSELAFAGTRGLVVALRGDRSRVAIRAQNEPSLLSGVSLGGEETAFLEVETSSGVEHVFKVGPRGVTQLFDLNTAMTDTQFYPANPDALAVGPRGELGVIRTASGSDPSSVHDPAVLLVPGKPAERLAPWSQAMFADDPACKDGFRTTLQLIGPWVKLTSPELRVVDDMPAIARVRWSDKMLCIEGIEVRLPAVPLQPGALPGTGIAETVQQATWLVGFFAAGSTPTAPRTHVFSRVGVGEGIEWRQPLECTRAR